ncbi:hypothetical protein C8R43DRAFT_948949 [Mycena crocata]|nr:hypothetical protein C8R43DRAFT_948949 [Mycena crocata]
MIKYWLFSQYNACPGNAHLHDQTQELGWCTAGCRFGMKWLLLSHTETFALSSGQVAHVGKPLQIAGRASILLRQLEHQTKHRKPRDVKSTNNLMSRKARIEIPRGQSYAPCKCAYDQPIFEANGHELRPGRSLHPAGIKNRPKRQKKWVAP